MIHVEKPNGQTVDHRTAQYATVNGNGFLLLYTSGEDDGDAPLAVYAPGAWNFYVRDEPSS